ncbi:hypothetical protein FHT98_0419 [Bosea sp. AK1]|nr:hypothetical protein FHT98_0419 [Bosea sp. AK1]
MGLGGIAFAARATAYAPVNVRDFGIGGNGLTDETEGWKALARQALQQPNVPIRGNRGDVYRIDGDTAIEMPDACQLILDGARFLRTKPVPRGRYLLTFGTDALVDHLDVEIGEGAGFSRLLRFYDRAHIEAIGLRAARRMKNKSSDLDAAVLFVGNQNKRTVADDQAGHFSLGRIESYNIDSVVLFTQFAVAAGQPNPLRDISIGTCRFRKAVLGLYLRNVRSGVVDDVRQSELADGAQSGEVGGNAILCSGVQDLVFRQIEANDTPSHGMRLGGPTKDTFEQETANVDIQSFKSRRSLRSGFKCKPGVDGSRARNVILKRAEIYDCHFGNAPSTNEQGVLLECVDGFSSDYISIGVREALDGTSSHDAVHLSCVTEARFGRLDSEKPVRHHIWINTTPQANYARGQAKNIIFETVNGRGAGGANVGVDGADQEIGNIKIRRGNFEGGKGVLDVRSGQLVAPIQIDNDAGSVQCAPGVDRRLVRVGVKSC